MNSIFNMLNKIMRCFLFSFKDVEIHFFFVKVKRKKTRWGKLFDFIFYFIFWGEPKYLREEGLFIYTTSTSKFCSRFEKSKCFELEIQNISLFHQLLSFFGCTLPVLIRHSENYGRSFLLKIPGKSWTGQDSSKI